MENTKKIKKSAFVLLAAVSFIMLYHIIVLVFNLAAHGFVLYPVIYTPDDPNEVQFNLLKNILYFMQTPIVLSIQVCAALLLLKIKKDETPFKLKNVRLLKIIAILLMIIEPLQFIAGRIPIAAGGNIITEDGTVLTPIIDSIFFPSGVIFAVGIVVYCVALIFNYGISLQEQSDETL